MKRAVMFGGGNIGRGFIGAVLNESGYHITFADVNMDLIDKINTLKTYTVNIVDVVCTKQVVTDISGVSSATHDVVDEIVKADLVTTAVGLRILPYIAQAMADGIAARKEAGMKTPLNIIACENAIRASSQLKKHVYDKMNDETKAYADEYIGFPDCAVDRIVPPATPDPEHPIDVTVENYYEWSVERSGFKGEIPEVKAMHVVDDLMAYLERKLFTLNTGHCVTAYLGVMKGYQTIDEAIADKKIYAIARGAMTESGNGLIAKHGFKPEDHWAYLETSLKRYANPYLHDILVRVGREPYRKMSQTDRLVGPMMNARSYGFTTDNLIKGIAAGLHFSYEGDAQAVEMQERIKKDGVKKVAAEVTGITDEGLLDSIVKEYETIASEIA